MAVFHSGDVRIDVSNKRLWQADIEVILVGLPFAVLCHLVRQAQDQAERLITKTELQRAVWRDVHVSEDTLRSCISRIRKALGDDPLNPRYIRTYAKEGWRWISPVHPALPVETSQAGSLQPPDASYDPAWYVERPEEERELLGCIDFPSRPIVVHGPKGAGKRTLLARVLERAVADEQKDRVPRVLRIGLRSFTDSHLTSLDAMLQEVGRRLLDPEEEDAERVETLLAGAWSKNIDPQIKLKRLIRTHLLVDSRVIYLVLTDADALAPWRYQSAWFDMLRTWQDAEGMGGLRLVLTSAIPPRLFPLGEHSPFWTKAARIEMPAFDEAHVAQLSRLYRLTPASPACRLLTELVGGSVSLCRQAIFRAAVRGVSLADVLREGQTSQHRKGPFAEHLGDLEEWLERRSDGAIETNGHWKQLLREAKTGVPLRSEDAWPLLRKGLLRETEQRGVYQLRCALYEALTREPQP